MTDADVADAICARLDARFDALEVNLTRRLNRIELGLGLLRLAVQGHSVDCPGDSAVPAERLTWELPAERGTGEHGTTPLGGH